MVYYPLEKPTFVIFTEQITQYRDNTIVGFVTNNIICQEQMVKALSLWKRICRQQSPSLQHHYEHD